MTVKHRAGSKIRAHDSWVNSLKALGVTAGSTPSTTWTVGTALAGTTYESIYNENWLARRIVQDYPDDALRKRPHIEDVDEQESDRIWEEYDRLNASVLYPHSIFAQAIYQGRALGGSVLLLGFKSGDPREPAPALQNGEMLWLDVAPWTDLTIVERETDANLATFGQPSLFRISGEHERNGMVIHASRCIPCEGLPRAKHRRSDTTPWLSVLQPIEQVLRDYDLSWESTALLLQEASVGVLKMQGLIRMLNAKNSSEIQARQQLMSQGRSAAKTVFLDAEYDEEFTRTEVSFGGVDRILEQLQQRICGAAGEPATRLFGRSPAGQNSTGESDMAIYDDAVAAYLRASIQPKHTQLLSLIAGKPVRLRYPPLREPSELEKAQLRKAQAEGDTAWFDLGVVAAGDIARSRSADGSLGVEIAPEQLEARYDERGNALAATTPTAAPATQPATA